MLLEHERDYDFGMDALELYALGTRTCNMNGIMILARTLSLASSRTRVDPRGPAPHNWATSLSDERCLGPAQHHMKSGQFEGGVGPA